MKLFLFFTLLFYKLNNFTFASYETVPSTNAQGSSSLISSSELLDDNQKQFFPIDDQISSIDIDYLKNGLVFQFRRSIKSDNSDIETRRRSALDKNFMRFGRANSGTNKNMMRFGRSNNLMRFDRADKSLMRFGRNLGNRMRFGKRDGNLMRFGRGSDSRMRFGKKADSRMRFGRSEQNKDSDSDIDIADNFLQNDQRNNLLIYGNIDKAATKHSN